MLKCSTCNQVVREFVAGFLGCSCAENDYKIGTFAEYPETWVSTHKPHNRNLGYVCELKNRRTGVGYVVIYDRNKGFDADTEFHYVIVCEEHGTMTSAPSEKRAREIMKAVDFCEECMAHTLEPENIPSGDVWMTSNQYVGL